MSDPHAPAARGSRKFAVSLFADLTGYTALCERLDPEDVERAVSPLMAGLQDAVERENGVVLNVAGDGLFAIFGVPDALPDSPTRAVRTAEQMRSVVAEIRERAENLTLPDVHIGVAAGEVLITPTSPGAWSVIGTSVNLASRLCDAAEAGEVLVEDSCRQLVQDELAWNSPRQLSLKGQDRETLAWPLASTTTRAGLDVIPDTFVGRRAQLAALDGELNEVISTARSRTVIVRGVAGIGKSSLVRHWLSQHAELPRWWVECDEGRRHDDLLSLHAALDDASSNAARTGRRERAAVDRSDPFPLIVHALRATLTEATSQGPHVLVVENLHASDTILGEFLLELSRSALEVPLLVVATWRDESAESAVGPGLLGRTLHLSALDQHDSGRLVEAVMGSSVDTATLEVIIGRANGHPLMIRESARHLASLVANSDGQVGPVAQVLLGSLPTSIRLFLAARIDRLDAATRAVIHDLSALGARFSGDRVRAVLGRRAEDALDRLAREGFLVAGANDWSFAHDLMREVAYSTLTRSQRADLHRRQLELLDSNADPYERADNALAWNEAVSPVDREQYASSTIAAVRETLALARQVFDRQARAALDVARRATSAARDCVALDPAIASQLWALEAQCLSELGMTDEALRLASQAERTAQDASLPANRLAPIMTRGYVLSTLRRFESARQALDEAAKIAEELGDQRAQAEAIRLLADTWRHSLIGRYIALTEEAYDLFVAASDRRGAGECARTLAYESSVGNLTTYAKWRSLAGELTHHDDVRAMAVLAKGDALAMGGRLRYREYEAASLALVDAGESLEAPDLLSEGLLDLADAQVHLGNPHGAALASKRLVALATELGDRRMRAAAAAASIRPLLRTGNLALSAEELRIAKDMAREFGVGEELFIGSEEAVWLADRGCWAQAGDPLRASLDAVTAGGYILAGLSRRAEEMRLAAVLGASWSGMPVRQLIADAREIDAPLIESFVTALDEWVRADRGADLTPAAAPDDACLEELALRSETRALAADNGGRDSAQHWQAARSIWDQLGYTIWLARAQARSGDLDAARHTLDVLDSPAEARAWALGDAAG